MSNRESSEPVPETIHQLRAEIADLRMSRKRLAEARASDRRGVERALHDGVQQHLVALAVELCRAAGMVDDNPASAKALLEELATSVQVALAETAQLAGSIYPPFLDPRGLASALRTAAAGIGGTAEVEVDVGTGYPAEILSTMYWCAMDAMACAAAGSEITIAITGTDGALTFDVKVTGGGAAGRLDRWRDHVEALGGHLVVDGRQDGFRIQGMLPRSG